MDEILETIKKSVRAELLQMIEQEKHMISEVTHKLFTAAVSSNEWDRFSVFLEDISKRFQRLQALCELDNKMSN